MTKEKDGHMHKPKVIKPKNPGWKIGMQADPDRPNTVLRKIKPKVIVPVFEKDDR